MHLILTKPNNHFSGYHLFLQRWLTFGCFLSFLLLWVNHLLPHQYIQFNDVGWFTQPWFIQCIELAYTVNLILLFFFSNYKLWIANLFSLSLFQLACIIVFGDAVLLIGLFWLMILICFVFSKPSASDFVLNAWLGGIILLIIQYLISLLPFIHWSLYIPFLFAFIPTGRLYVWIDKHSGLEP